MTVHSNQRNPWRRLKKNKAAIAGMVVIVAAFIIAVFAYFVSPDSSPNANRMIVEIGGRKPGFSQQFFLLPKEGMITKQSFFERLFYGKKDVYEFIPIQGYAWRRDSVIVNKYIDEGITERIAYPRTGGDNENKQIILKKFLLGTDKYGRDILSRLIIGVRVSLAVGLDGHF